MFNKAGCNTGIIVKDKMLPTLGRVVWKIMLPIFGEFAVEFQVLWPDFERLLSLLKKFSSLGSFFFFVPQKGKILSLWPKNCLPFLQKIGFFS